MSESYKPRMLLDAAIQELINDDLYLQTLETKMNESANDAEFASRTISDRTVESSLYMIALELRAERHRKTFHRAYDLSRSRPRAILEVPSE